MCSVCSAHRKFYICIIMIHTHILITWYTKDKQRPKVRFLNQSFVLVSLIVEWFHKAIAFSLCSVFSPRHQTVGKKYRSGDTCRTIWINMMSLFSDFIIDIRLHLPIFGWNNQKKERERESLDVHTSNQLY